MKAPLCLEKQADRDPRMRPLHVAKHITSKEQGRGSLPRGTIVKSNNFEIEEKTDGSMEEIGQEEVGRMVQVSPIPPVDESNNNGSITPLESYLHFGSITPLESYLHFGSIPPLATSTPTKKSAFLSKSSQDPESCYKLNVSTSGVMKPREV